MREYFPHPRARKYQADLANQLYDALSAGFRDMVIEAPTGLGKGLNGVSRVRLLSNKPGERLFLRNKPSPRRAKSERAYFGEKAEENA